MWKSILTWMTVFVIMVGLGCGRKGPFGDNRSKTAQEEDFDNLNPISSSDSDTTDTNPDGG